MASNVTDPKKRVIMFRFTDYCEVDFDEWYSHKKDEFKTEADALKKWVSMCDLVGDEVEVTDGDGSRDWDDYFASELEEIEKDVAKREVVAGPPEPLVKGEDYEDYEEEEDEEEPEHQILPPA